MHANRRFRALAVGTCLAALLGMDRVGAQAPSVGPVPKRIVSLNPSLTAMLVALGASERLVGVDDWSARHSGLSELPRVGGLHTTSLEAVAALRPDLVVLVPSVEQQELRQGLSNLGIERLELDPVGFDEVLEAVLALGQRVGRSQAAHERVATVRATRARIERGRADAPRLRGVLVLTRDPLFVVGSGSFIDEMLDTVGVDNLGAALEGTYPRASLEWLVASQPDLIVDASGDADSARRFWSRWPSLPAVQEGRVVAIPQGVATLPGPHLDRGLELLERVVVESTAP